MARQVKLWLVFAPLLLRALAVCCITLFAAVASLTFHTGRVSQPAAAQTPGTLTWRACGGGLECTELQVPLDYGNPAARSISIALIRLRASDPANRIGSLLVNPGGPGGSGIGFVRSWASFLPREITSRFDIVGFDPRGVGASTPLLCHDRLQSLAGLDPTPDSDLEWRAGLDELRAFADLCARRGGDLLPHLGTANVVRDLEQMRIALGDAKLTYAGFSYGTVIGALYAEMFPDKVRAILLDGPMDPSLPADELAVQQSRGFDGAMEHFLADCRRRQCLLGVPGDPAAAVDDLLRRAEAAPIPALRADRAAGPGEVLLGLFAALYTPRLWPDMESAISRGLAGDATELVRLVDSYLNRQSNGSYENATEMYSAVACLDAGFPRNIEYFQRLLERAKAEAPRFGAMNVYTWLPCAFWAAPPQPLPRIDAQGSPPILVLGTTGDPATPYAWAVSMSRQLASAVLLTYRGEGHTAYLNNDRCINDAVHRYVIDLVLPPAGTACGAGPAEPLVVANPSTPTPQPAPTAAPPQAQSQNPTPQSPGAAPSATGAASDDDGQSPALIAGGVVLVALAAGGVAYLLVKRRQSGT